MYTFYFVADGGAVSFKSVIPMNMTGAVKRRSSIVVAMENATYGRGKNSNISEASSNGVIKIQTEKYTNMMNVSPNMILPKT